MARVVDVGAERTDEAGQARSYYERVLAARGFLLGQYVHLAEPIVAYAGPSIDGSGGLSNLQWVEGVLCHNPYRIRGEVSLYVQTRVPCKHRYPWQAGSRQRYEQAGLYERRGHLDLLRHGRRSATGRVLIP